jgi:uncharacterized protein
MVRFATALLALFLLTTSAQADQASKLAGIKLYLDVIGMNATVLRMVNPLAEQYMEAFERVRPDATEDARAAMRQILQQEFTQGVPELIDSVAALYDKAFSEEEVAALVAFHESPAGRKLLQISPQVQRESAMIGQEWGRRMAEKAGQVFQETYKPK